MSKIEDVGKVWFPGSIAPVMAVRVGNTVFALGDIEGQAIEYWIEGKFLCLDLQEKKTKIRIARRFPLETVPKKPATLFGGFEKTPHADIKVVTNKDPGVEESIFYDVDYVNSTEINGRDFWKKVNFPSTN
tara:strand:- start:322 stop:714 length:393 start_codon:yes stop_codon:yes gene_type:complete